MSKLGINVPTEAITDAFIRNAGSLHRCHVMLRRVPKDLRKACDKIVHYGRLALCRVPRAHGKPKNTHGKGFAVCRTQQTAVGKGTLCRV